MRELAIVRGMEPASLSQIPVKLRKYYLLAWRAGPEAHDKLGPKSLNGKQNVRDGFTGSNRNGVMLDSESKTSL